MQLWADKLTDWILFWFFIYVEILFNLWILKIKFSEQCQCVDGEDAVHEVIFPVNCCDDVLEWIGIARGMLYEGTAYALIDAAIHNEFI